MVKANGEINYTLTPNQNDFVDTVVAPYAVRPYHIPSVSTPLEWKELKSSLDPTAFTIYTIRKRMEKKADIFKDVMDNKSRYLVA